MPKDVSTARKNKQKKGSRKKLVDTFAKKEWYVIKVPSYIPMKGNHYRVGFTPCKKAGAKKALDSRTFVINLGDLQEEKELKENKNDDFNCKKFKFITEEVFGNQILTQFHGMQITRDKRCSLIRKWHSMIEAICDSKTTDGYVLRVKALAFTKRQLEQVKKNCYAKHSQARQIRARMCEIIKSAIGSSDLESVVKQLSEGKIGDDIRKSCQLTFPLKTCLIEKVKVLKKPKKDTAKMMQLHQPSIKVSFDDLRPKLDEIEEDEDDNEEDEDKNEEEEDGDINME